MATPPFPPAGSVVSKPGAALVLALASMTCGWVSTGAAAQESKPPAPAAPTTTGDAPPAPAAPPALPAPAAPPAPTLRQPPPTTSAPVVTPVADAPTPQALWDAFTEASGGRDAFPSTGSRRLTGKMLVPAAGLAGRIETRLRSPDRLLVIVNLPAMGEARHGYDGTHGWVDHPARGAHLSTEAELVTVRREASFQGPIGHLALARDARTLGEANFRKRATWAVELDGLFGGKAIYYFDKSDGLLRGMFLTAVTADGPRPVEVEFLEYANFGPAKLASKTALRSMMQEIWTTIEDVSTDEMPESELEPPPAVKALIEAKLQGDAESGTGAKDGSGAKDGTGAEDGSKSGTGSNTAPAR